MSGHGLAVVEGSNLSRFRVGSRPILEQEWSEVSVGFPVRRAVARRPAAALGAQARAKRHGALFRRLAVANVLPLPSLECDAFTNPSGRVVEEAGWRGRVCSSVCSAGPIWNCAGSTATERRARL